MVAAVVESGLPTRGPAGTEVVAELLDLLAARPSYWRTLVHAVLDSPEAALPGTASTTELFSGLWRYSDTEGDDDQAVPTSVAGMTVLGWLIFGRFMTDATGADPEAARRAVAEHVAAMISTQT